MRRRRSRPILLPAALCAVAAALAWRVMPYLPGPDLIEQTQAAESKTASQSKIDRTSDTNGPPAQNPPDAERFAVVTARNLFSPDRAPVPGAKAAVEPAPEAPDLQLVGVALMDGDDRAILHPANDQEETLMLTLGAVYQGWTVTALTARSVTLSRGEDDVTYFLDFTTDR